MGALEERLVKLSAAVRASKKVWEDDREARDAAIEEADELGLALRDIARITGMSVGHVQRIVVERTARRQGGNHGQDPGGRPQGG